MITGVPPGLYTVEVRRLGYAVAYEENVAVPDNGTVTVNIPAGVASDLAGNLNTAATEYSVVVNSDAPTPVITDDDIRS